MRTRARPVLLVAALAAAAAAVPAAAEEVAVRAGVHDSYGRIVFNWLAPVGYQATVSESALVVRFERPIEAAYDGVVRTLAKYLRDARPGADGRTVSFTLTGRLGLRDFHQGNTVVIDLLNGASPANGSAPAAATLRPAAARGTAEAAAGPPAGEGAAVVRVRSGDHEGYSRLVFDWPDAVGYRVERKEGTAVITFDRPARVNLAEVKAKPPKFVRGVEAAATAEALIVTVTLAENSRIRDLRSGPKVVVDVLAPSAPEAAPSAAPAAAAKTAAAPAQPPPASPKPTPLVPERAKTAPPPAAGRGAESAAAPPPAGGTAAAVAAAPTPPAAGTPAPAAPTRVPPAGSGQAVILRLDWDGPVAAAVFRRAGPLWAVFDKATTVDLQALRAAGGNILRGVEQLPVEGVTVLRMDTVAGVNPNLRRDGLAWLLEFRQQPVQTPTPIEVQAEPTSPAGARIFLPVTEPGKAVAVGDPEVGDNLVVVPVMALGQGVDRDRQYPQLAILPSIQGVVIRPKTDDLRVRPTEHGIELTSASALLLSPVATKAEGEARAEGGGLGIMRALTRVFDLEQWRRGELNDFTPNKQKLQGAVVAAKDKARDDARLELARFYFAFGFAAEAVGVLDVMGETQPEFLSTAEFRGLRGASHLLMGHFDEAREDLGHPSLADNDEAAFWQAAQRALEGDLAGAATTLRRTGAIVRPYPKALKLPMGLLVAEAAIVLGDIRQATVYLDLLKGEDLNPAQKDQVAYTTGRLQELSGNFDAAVAKWDEAIAGPHRPSRAKAAMARVELLLKLRKMSRPEAIEELEKLRFAWRGDDFVLDLLQRLGELYLAEGDFRNGLRTLRQAVTYFRGHRKAGELTQLMTDAFARLYLGAEADSLPPVAAIALYDEFKELTPAGAKGDEMIRKLADRLVAVDLLDRAAELLQAQVQFRLQGVEKARVGTQLALVHMLNRKPDKAQEALRTTEGAGLPAELATQRRHLMARALAAAGRTPEALALVKDDKSVDAEILRGELYWEAQDWPNAAQVIRRLIGEFGAAPGKPLDDKQGRYVLNLAIALTLSGNERAVSRLRTDYGQAMDNGPLGNAFRLIASPQTPGLPDYRAVADKVSDVENFQEFLAAYRERLRTQNLSKIN